MTAEECLPFLGNIHRAWRIAVRVYIRAAVFYTDYAHIV